MSNENPFDALVPGSLAAKQFQESPPSPTSGLPSIGDPYPCGDAPPPVLAMPSLATDRVTVVETVHLHQIDGGPDTSVESRYSRTLKSNGEQAFYRRYRVGSDWAPIECGHLKWCSYLLLSNREGMNLQKIPTPSERDAIASRVVELRFESPFVSDKPHVEVAPGESCRLVPSAISSTYVRCRHTAMIELNLLPE